MWVSEAVFWEDPSVMIEEEVTEAGLSVDESVGREEGSMEGAAVDKYVGAKGESEEVEALVEIGDLVEPVTTLGEALGGSDEPGRDLVRMEEGLVQE